MTCVGILVGWILKLEPHPGFVGSLGCFAVFQALGDLCFLTISRQPAVAIQVSGREASPVC